MFGLSRFSRYFSLFHQSVYFDVIYLGELNDYSNDLFQTERPCVLVNRTVELCGRLWSFGDVLEVS